MKNKLVRTYPFFTSAAFILLGDCRDGDFGDTPVIGAHAVLLSPDLSSKLLV